MKPNEILHGNCLDIVSKYPDNYFDMALCDLPYGTTSCKWDTIIPLKPLWKHYKRIVKDTGAIVLTASQPFTSVLVMSNPGMFKYEWIWEKSRASDFINANFRPMKKHESVLVFSQGGAAPGCNLPMNYNPQGVIYKDRKRTRKGSLGIGRDRESQQGDYISKGTNYPNSILEIKNEKKTLHPTQKPVELFEYLINTYTNIGDIVLDNCAGSGTTGEACSNLGRNFVLIEKERKYYDICVERIQAMGVKINA